MKKLILLIAFAVVALPSFVLAEQSNTGSSPVLDEPIRNEVKSRTMSSWEEARQEREEMLEKRKECLENRDGSCEGLMLPKTIETMKVNQEKRMEEREVKIEERKQKLEERKLEIKNRVTERLAEAFGKTFENFKNVSEKLLENTTKLEERISGFEAKGRDLSVAKAQLEEAKVLINTLPSTIESAEAKVTSLLTGEDPKSKVTEIKQVLNETKEQIKKAHQALIEAINEIKNNIKSDKADDSVENETN